MSEQELRDIVDDLRDIVDTNEFHDNILSIVPSDDETSLYRTVTQEQFAEFERYLVVDILKGLRYGQAFCERFGISNASPLYHFRGREISERWIRENYLVKDTHE